MLKGVRELLFPIVYVWCKYIECARLLRHIYYVRM